MEPITHFLTGACLGRAGLNRKTALATAATTLAAEAPDLDVLYDFGGRITGFQHHRGWTHTFLGLFVMAALVVALLYVWYRWKVRRGKWKHDAAPRWGLLYVFCLIAGLSHLLLDFTNNYGVRPFMPFSYRWYSWDIVFIVEPVLWIVLVGGLVMPSLFGLIDSEIGARRKGLRGRGWAIAALMGMVVVWGVRDFEHRKAVNALQSLTYDGVDAQRVSAFPSFLNPFRWVGVVETAKFFEVMQVNSLNAEVDPQNRARVYYKNPETPVTLAAKKSRLGRVFLDWAQYPYVEEEPLTAPESGYIVHFRDLRFTDPETQRSVLRAYVQVDPGLHVVDQNFERVLERERMRRNGSGQGAP
jgi:inner membrane protein